MPDPAVKTDFEISLASLAGATVPNLADYFGVWAIAEEVFRGWAQHVGEINLYAHVVAHQTPEKMAEASARAGASFDVIPGSKGSGDIALVQLSGSLMKSVGSMTAGTSTIAARRQIRQAAQNEDVAGILLVIDSPGGTVSGTQELADDVAAAALKKPVYVQIEDLGASAAYWVASQGTQIAANRTGQVGSIGTFMVVNDLSALAAKEGVKVHVIRAGDFKGAGVPGTEVTGAQLTEWQRTVTALNEHFLAGVARGRKMSPDAVRQLADGRVHIAEEARAKGLIDAVQSLDQTLAQLRSKIQSTSPKGPRSMSIETATAPTPPAAPAPQPASYQQLAAAFPKAGNDFICAQLAKGHTLEQARAAHAEDLQTKLEASQAEVTKLKAAPPAPKPGVAALTTETKTEPGASNAGTSREKFDGLVAVKIAAGKSRQLAVSAVVRENPELHQAMLDEANAGRRRNK